MLNFKVYHNSQDSYYRSPFGAVPCGTKVDLSLEVITPIPEIQCQLRVWEKGTTERLLSMKVREKEQEESYRQVFEIEYQVPDGPGLVWYYFRLIVGGQVYYYGNNAEALGGEGSLSDYEPPGYQITVFLPNKVPSWYKKGVMYQIFVDRFYSAQRSSTNEAESTIAKAKGLLHLNWYDTPFYLRDEKGRINRWTFFGGNLAGIIEKLGYLKELGISILYLNPIFEAPSSHKYDTGDYLTIDPMYGNEIIFRQLIQEARKRGISIILDGVFSHTGSDSIYFNKYGNYPSLGAFQSPESPYYNWYIFTKYPHEYESWWGVDVLPNVNEMEPSYREFIYGGENSVLRHWLRAGAKGWRLDVADELPDEFIKELRQAMKKTDQDAVLIGEVWEDASNKTSYGKLREYFWGEELDATMNYPWRGILLGFLLGEIGASLVHRKIMSLYENYPRENFYAAMNLIGSHDRVRILTLLGEAPQEETLSEGEKEKYKLGAEAKGLAVKRLKLFSLAQMTFPGVPCIYYGDEAGLEGYSDPYNRGTYPWGREDKDLLAWYQRSIRLRREYKVLEDGLFESFYQGEDVYGFRRKNHLEQIIVLINRSLSEEREGRVALELEGDISREELIVLDLLQGTMLDREWDGILRMPPLGVKVIYLKKRERQLETRELPKAGGILLSITSLPSIWGVGDLGEEAYRFVDFLEASGQKVWQILPLNPLGPGNSPYQSSSAFAGNELLIDPQQLLQAGLLERTQIAEEQKKMTFGNNTARASFIQTAASKERLYRKAFRNFHDKIKREKARGVTDDSGPLTCQKYIKFQQENAFWLDDYCLYTALKKEFADKPWYSWEESIASREEDTLAIYRENLAKEIDYYRFLQYIFNTQWQRLREYANSKGIYIVGDLPIYVAPDSCDTWANPHLFCLDDAGKPLKVAGVPPDYFAETGQLWGNPLYDWDGMEQDGYSWWVARVRRVLQMVDYLRLDHFRGFEAFWEVPGNAKTAMEGRWLKGPGKKFFEVLTRELGSLPFLAEDLGFLTPEVHNLKNIFSFPGMKVFQFSPEEMLSEREPKGVYYTGTHDNDTLISWYKQNRERLESLLENSFLEESQGASREEIIQLEQGKLNRREPEITISAATLKKDHERDICRKIIERLYQSKAPWVVVPLQDILGLDTEARMNVPGTAEGNWEWQFDWSLLTEDVITWLRQLARDSGRSE